MAFAVARVMDQSPNYLAAGLMAGCRASEARMPPAASLCAGERPQSAWGGSIANMIRGATARRSARCCRAPFGSIGSLMRLAAIPPQNERWDACGLFVGFSNDRGLVVV
jgi:hypothetical protein